MQFPVELFVFNNVDDDEMRRGGAGGGGGGVNTFSLPLRTWSGAGGRNNNDRVADEWKQNNSVLLHLYNCIYISTTKCTGLGLT